MKDTKEGKRGRLVRQREIEVERKCGGLEWLRAEMETSEESVLRSWKEYFEKLSEGNGREGDRCGKNSESARAEHY